MKPPRLARLEDLVTDLKPTTPSSTRPETSAPTSNHRQLELDLPTKAGSPESLAPPSETPTDPVASEPPSISTNPVASRRWAMTWKPDADATDRNAQHPAARVARENVDAAINQPSIPAIQSPNSNADLTTGPAAIVITDDDASDEMAPTVTPASEHGVDFEPPSDSTDLTDETSVADAATADVGFNDDRTSTPAVPPAATVPEPVESEIEAAESHPTPEVTATPEVTTIAPDIEPTSAPAVASKPALEATASPAAPAPSASPVPRVAAAGWIVAVLIGLGWLIASNQPAEQPAKQPTAPPPAATAATAVPADAETIPALEAAISDLQATSARATDRISALEVQVEQARSDAAYLNRERTLLQAELEGLMEIIEAPATATTDTAADG